MQVWPEVRALHARYFDEIATTAEDVQTNIVEHGAMSEAVRGSFAELGDLLVKRKQVGSGDLSELGATPEMAQAFTDAITGTGYVTAGHVPTLEQSVGASTAQRIFADDLNTRMEKIRDVSTSMAQKLRGIDPTSPKGQMVEVLGALAKDVAAVRQGIEHFTWGRDKTLAVASMQSLERHFDELGALTVEHGSASVGVSANDRYILALHDAYYGKQGAHGSEGISIGQLARTTERIDLNVTDLNDRLSVVEVASQELAQGIRQA